MNHPVAEGKQIEIDPQAAQIEMFSDETILHRIIGNMTKNALEATGQGDSIRLSCSREDNQIRFTVHNPGLIPKEVQLQIFQRSFSTKGTGRGVGTYSIKLLSEQYLNGEVGFTSTESEGTSFYGIYPLGLKDHADLSSGPETQDPG
jgi:signal transduction histidine kinase